jgi:hypothetical protein
MRNLDWLPHHTDALADAAEAYAANGWAVFPLHSVKAGRCSCGHADCDNPGKHPRIANGFHKASTDVEQVREWWKRWPDAPIGGAVQPGCWVLDEDQRAGGHLERQRLEHEHGPLPFTLRQTTGGGGFHWVFAVPEGCAVRQMAKFAPGLDTRAAGKGYIILAPSLHKSGKRYQWHTAIEPLEAPEWLFDLVRAPPKVAPIVSLPPSVWRGQSLTRRERLGRAVLDGVCKKVAAECEGNRNELLNWAWHKIGQYADVVGEDEARSALRAAGLACGLGEREIRQVLR